MPKRSRKKRPADPNALAASIVDDVIAISERSSKHPAAVALGRLGGKIGGLARAKKLSAKKRSEIAKAAAAARWKKK
jgi:hypothetical protein